jgi:uncharacterized membrane protein
MAPAKFRFLEASNMQNPPPGPPPGGQPPSYQPPGGQPGYPPPGYQPPGTASGVDKKTGAILSYALGWITGIVFLFVGKDDPDVKFHAAQSIIFFGGSTILLTVLNIFERVLPDLISLLLVIAGVVITFFTFIMWIVCLVQAASNNGARFQIPLVGGFVTPYAEQLANAVN